MVGWLAISTGHQIYQKKRHFTTDCTNRHRFPDEKKREHVREKLKKANRTHPLTGQGMKVKNLVGDRTAFRLRYSQRNPILILYY